MAAYGTAEGLAAYAASLGTSVPAGSVAGALLRASAYIDGRYGRRFSGARAGGFAQERAWPRAGATTAEGFAVPADAVPLAVVNATYEAALRELAEPGSLSPDYVAGDAVTKMKAGSVELSFATPDASMGAAAAQPVFTVIDEMLADLLVLKLPAVLVV